jgi:hypothetical protein
MVHSSKTLVDPVRIQKNSLLFAFIISFALILNSHSFNTIAGVVFSKATLHKIEAKATYYLDFGLTEDVAKTQQDKDLDNSFAD